MKPINIVLSGLGGQGILFMTRVLAQAFLDHGFPVMVAETHGMAQGWVSDFSPQTRGC